MQFVSFVSTRKQQKALYCQKTRSVSSATNLYGCLCKRYTRQVRTEKSVVVRWKRSATQWPTYGKHAGHRPTRDNSEKHGRWSWWPTEQPTQHRLRRNTQVTLLGWRKEGLNQLPFSMYMVPQPASPALPFVCVFWCNPPHCLHTTAVGIRKRIQNAMQVMQVPYTENRTFAKAGHGQRLCKRYAHKRKVRKVTR